MKLERKIMFDQFRDSYSHYRKDVGLGRIHSFYRALYYEIKHKEPYA